MTPAVAVTLLAVATAATLIALLRRAGVVPLALFAAFWFVFIGILAHHGFFSNFTALPPHLLLALVFPAVAFALYSLSSKHLAKALHETPITWLLAFQAFRIFVELLLWRGYKLGNVPVQMTFDGRNVDIFIGLTAPLAAWIYARTRSKAFGIAWNLAGLVSLFNIVTISILSMPTPLRRFFNDPPNTQLTHFPFIYLPAVLVPCAYLAHALSLRQLLQRKPPALL